MLKVGYDDALIAVVALWKGLRTARSSSMIVHSSLSGKQIPDLTWLIQKTCTQWLL